MTLPFPFEQGIQSALHCHWRLTLKTPLVIRSGKQASYKNNKEGYKKGRGQETEFSWEKTEKDDDQTWTEVADFNYQFTVGTDDELTVDYAIPPSSVRGALRQWLIKTMVEKDERSLFQSPKLEGFSKEEKTKLLYQMSVARTKVADTGHNWHHILSLFGNAFDFTPEELEKQDPMTWTGRLIVTTMLAQGSKNSIDGIETEHMPPNALDNIQRHINARNPLDRMTMAAKEHGLHHTLEMSSGQEFEVKLQIFNPKAKDIEMLQLWEEDINDGFLRFGGLTSQGRGRCEISNSDYELFAPLTSALARQISTAEQKCSTGDKILESIWSGASFTLSELRNVFKNIDKPSKADES